MRLCFPGPRASPSGKPFPETMRRTYALIQKNDTKARAWQVACSRRGFDLVAMPGSAVYVPLQLLASILCRGKPRAVVLRYLGDYPNISRALLRFVSEMFSIMICVALRIRLVWICHNVDRDTNCFHPRMLQIRRKMFLRFASRILVTDPRLIPGANHHLRSPEKTDYLTFGDVQQSPGDAGSRQLTEDVRRFVLSQRASFRGDPRSLRFGWVAGGYCRKTAHFERILDLLDAAEQAGYALRMIVVLTNPQDLERKQPGAVDRIRRDPRVLFRDHFIPTNERDISALVDFYWRAYRDLSVSFTLYHAASMGKPILAQDIGFVGEAVRHYKLGAVVREDFSDIHRAMAELAQWNPRRAAEFLKSHNWDDAAARLVHACWPQRAERFRAAA